MWKAVIFYDQGRLGHAACFGLKTREDAIAWLDRAFSWDLCSYKLPSCWIEQR